MLTASPAAHAPKWVGFGMPAPPATMWTSAAQCRGGFRKKVFGPPLCPRRKRGGGAYRGEKLISESRVANCTLPCWTLSGVGYGRAQHRHHPNRRYGRMHVHRTRRMRCSWRACSGRAHEEARDAAPIVQPPRVSESGAMNGGGGGAPSNSSAFAHAARSWHARGEEGKPERRRPEPAHSCRPTWNSIRVHAKRALRGRFSDSRISRPLGCGTA